MAKEHQIAFGTVVRNRRRQLGISQECLAEKSNLHRTYISDVERGYRNISLDAIVNIAAALGGSLSELFAEVDALRQKQTDFLKRIQP